MKDLKILTKSKRSFKMKRYISTLSFVLMFGLVTTGGSQSKANSAKGSSISKLGSSDFASIIECLSSARLSSKDYYRIILINYR